MEHVELKGVEKENLKAEIGEEKKEVKVDNGRPRGAGGGRGERKPPLGEVQEEENEKEGMDKEVNKEDKGQ